MQNTNKFTYWIILLPILAIVITSSILTYEFISFENQKLQEEKIKLRTEHVEEIKNRIQSRVNRISNLIETNIKLTYEEEKRAIKDIVNIGHKTISQIYKENSHLSEEEIITKITNQLKGLRFYNNGSGYFFINNLDYKVIMQPQTPEYIGKNVKDIKDKDNKYFIRSFNKIITEKTEGFDTWSWSKPETNKIEKKIGYIKLFKPLNIYIGTAKYEEDINTRIKNDAIKLIDTIKFAKDEYMFAINPTGTVLSHINKNFIGKNLKELSKVEQTIVQTILLKAKNKNGSFLGYTPTSHNVSKKLSQKISFVKTIPTLGWALGTGQYTTQVEKKLLQKELELKKELEKSTNKIIFISLIISFLLIIILAYISKKLQDKFKRYEEELNENNKELQVLNNTLESKVKKQVLKIREKDEILNQQAKLASMGEMIGNIAHQWRQPLSTISTVASGTQIQDELDLLKKETLHENLNVIIKNTQVLSQTIEDFRNFFKNDKEKVSFFINETIEKVLVLISAGLTNKNITIIKEIEHLEVYNLENELKQALLNILSNAKDALIESNQEDKIILISTKEINNKLHIFIKDNAGGIDKSILDKIFEPYFTTKFKAQGTGIGLYMSRTIIINHMKGQIFARNEKVTYKEKEYMGAVFEIILNKKG